MKKKRRKKSSPEESSFHTSGGSGFGDFDSEGSDFEPLSDEEIFEREYETCNIVYKGMLDMQQVLYGYASRQKSRIHRLSFLVDEIEKRIFDPEVLQSLPPKELVKVLSLLLENQQQSIQFMERLFRLTLSAHEVISAARTLAEERLETSDESLEGGEGASRPLSSSFGIALDPSRAAVIRDIILRHASEVSKSSK